MLVTYLVILCNKKKRTNAIFPSEDAWVWCPQQGCATGMSFTLTPSTIGDDGLGPYERPTC